ncbi:MAG: hypothetical protein K6G17_07505 [Oscillospiraceae bacterium]|nr:hypothetical protein [Oscillospiraceae bacterium]
MKNAAFRSILCCVLLLAVMAALVLGVNAVTAPIVAENERRAAEAAAEAEKALLGGSVLLYDREKPGESTLSVASDKVLSVYQDNEKQVYLLRLSTSEGYTKLPIELTLIIDFEGKIVSLTQDSTQETKELPESYLTSFPGQDSTLAGVIPGGTGATYSATAIKSAVNDGFNALIDNGLFAAAEKDESLVIREQLEALLPSVYPGLFNKDGFIQGEETEGSGAVTSYIAARNGSGFACYLSDDSGSFLGVWTDVGGGRIYNAAGETVDNAELLAQLEAFCAPMAGTNEAASLKGLSRKREGVELTAVQIPGLASTVTGAYRMETEEGTLYGFAARPYGYDVMDAYYVLDENGAIVSLYVDTIIIEKDYFPNAPEIKKADYQEPFVGLTGDSYSGEQAIIAGATMTSDAMDAATRDVFEAFGLLMESRG